ncbi:hypothetical protein R5W24_004863 [Gemmata sp. JC717]|uniref:Uncharacterized protein n=1 Tax=Gemmata algarum TaxID=2975278 RepID=A0ABU5EWM0_9BACT|nr:hypothetical protein [Gemmata algarum]MDY3555718.1 hypothetical protein [Gemmata algarum]MDY3559339.1 hypothetical protein [Gemmata algarum]
MEPKLQELLQAVIAKTPKGELKWRSHSDESFRVAVGSGHVHISRSPGRTEGESDAPVARTYLAQVTDAQRRVVTETQATTGHEGDGALLAELFEVARKSALKTESVLNEMLDVLRGTAAP